MGLLALIGTVLLWTVSLPSIAIGIIRWGISRVRSWERGEWFARLQCLARGVAYISVLAFTLYGPIQPEAYLSACLNLEADNIVTYELSTKRFAYVVGGDDARFVRSRGRLQVSSPNVLFRAQAGGAAVIFAVSNTMTLKLFCLRFSVLASASLKVHPHSQVTNFFSYPLLH